MSSVVRGSFRDPSGFLFRRGGTLFRQVNDCYREDYRFLRDSGLYDRLVERKLLVPHREVDEEPFEPQSAFRVIEPEELPFVSYPYEWCFGQLKAAARLTLEVQRICLEHGMVLKDASAYNVQLLDGRPIFIDTLSFARYQEGEPWFAYRQFCQHFLAPLALASRVDIRLLQLLRVFVDGVPLDLASRLLGGRSWLRWSLLSHLHLQALAERTATSAAGRRRSAAARVSRSGLIGIVASLTSAVDGLRWRPRASAWSDYYSETNYSEDATAEKERRIAAFLDRDRPDWLWDLGANDGRYSRLASTRGCSTLALDLDPTAVEHNWAICARERDPYLLPLWMDLDNPSPDLGWELEERPGLLRRGHPDAVMALALVHHLVIGNNVPLARVASFFARLAPRLYVEFVPKSDSQVMRMLETRQDIFSDYTRESFEREFGRAFETLEVSEIGDSGRLLYRMRRHD